MKGPYLEVTYRRGRPLAAYLYLPRPNGAKCARSEPRSAGLIVDFSPDGSPIGLEITAPKLATIEAVNAVLAELGIGSIAPGELAPLRAA